MSEIGQLTLRQQLTRRAFLCWGLTLFICTVGLLLQQAWQQRSSRIENWQALTRQISRQCREPLPTREPQQLAFLLATLTDETGLEAAWLYDPQGKLLAATPPAQSTDSAISPSQPAGVVSRNDRLYIVQPLSGTDQPGSGTLIVRVPEPGLLSLNLTTLGLAGGLLTFSLWLGRALTARQFRRSLRPLEKLSYRIAELATQHRPDCRLAETGPTEISRLAGAVNLLFSHWEGDSLQLANGGEQFERKLARETVELVRTREQEKESSRAKSEFIAHISHEIRTLLTSILGSAQLFIEDDLSAVEREQTLAILQRNGANLLTIIDDILNISQIEAGHIRIQQADFSPFELTGEVTRELETQAARKGLSLITEFHGNIPATIYSDASKLRRILVQLLQNAIQSTDYGSVTLAVSMRDVERDLLGFEIIDTGLGMTPAQRRQLFRPFAQADRTTPRPVGSTGLGLTIIRRYAQLLGGDITLESEFRRGSRFQVTIHAGRADLAEQSRRLIRQLRPVSLPGQKGVLNANILLMEDIQDNQRLICYFLEKVGATVSLADNGQQGLETFFRAKEAGQRFDAVITDMQMPVMDGYTVTRRLREAGYAGPILALTAHALSMDRERCLTAGCTEYFTKPIDREVLIGTLQRLLTESGPAPMAKESQPMNS